MDDCCYEVPADGLSEGLAPEETAHQELLEEIGGLASQCRYMGQSYTSNGISNKANYVYLTMDVELGKANHEPTELMEIRLVPAEDALRMARSGEISDGPSALTLLWCGSILAKAHH